MNISVDMTDFGKIRALMNKCHPAGRAQLNQVGANKVAASVQRHIKGYSRGKHFTANELGAAKTGHYEDGAAAITSDASADRAEVSIPIPGIGRAYHDIFITTPTKNGKRYVTIPKHAESYGQTVNKMKARGWKIFRPGKKLCLLGYKNKKDKPILLFALAEEVHQRQDPTLLPSKVALGQVFASGVASEVRRIMRKAGR